MQTNGKHDQSGSSDGADGLDPGGLGQTSQKEYDNVTAMLDNAPGAMLILDRQLQIRSFNGAAARLLRLQPNDVGCDVDAVLARVKGQRRPADADLSVTKREQVERIPDSGNPGSIVCRVLPAGAVDGQAEGAVLSFAERSDIQYLAAGLRESEMRFHAFMDNSPMNAWIKDEDGRYLYVNAAYEKRFAVRRCDWPNGRRSLARRHRGAIPRE